MKLAGNDVISFFVNAFYQVEEVLFYPKFVEFPPPPMKGCCIGSGAFSVCIKIVMWFLSFNLSIYDLLL